MEYSILIIVVPFVLFLFIGLLGMKMKPNITGIIGTLGMGLCTVLSYTLAYQYFFKLGKVSEKWTRIIPLNFEWFRFTEHLHINLGILLDPISILMLVIVATISLMVHVYSLGYMNGEAGFQRYYAFISFFSFSMFGLVVATNIFQMYIFWELVGVSSYFLIGFYYTKSSAVAASKKAFIVTRFADLGFLIGILLLSFYTKTFDFGLLTSDHASLVKTSFSEASFMGLSAISWTMALIFVGGAGKSAMFPLHIWLPDAMEGPTPVSALIHAATMVVAGVYLIARLFPVYFFTTPKILEIISFIGAFTSLFAAVIAITQTDIKRVLAFSTISQIAYMMSALGVSGYGTNHHDGLGYTASIFHLFTHAFFKALLFLGAGLVIHTVHSNEISRMGCLHKHMKITSFTFLAACFAIAGIPPFSGFFSKDEILTASFHYQWIVFLILLVVAGLTAFYIFRLYFCVFWNSKHGDTEYYNKSHESSVQMVLPLVILAFFSIFTGVIPFGRFISTDGIPFHMHIDWAGIASTSMGISVIGIVIAYLLYCKNTRQSTIIAQKAGGFYSFALHKFYLDEVWLWITKTIIFRYICEPIQWFDRHVIDGCMNGFAWVVQKSSFSIKKLQSGHLQLYALVFFASSILITIFVLLFLV